VNVLGKVWSLYVALKQSGVLPLSTLLFGQMGENPAVRFMAAFAALTIAEYYKEKMKKDVLFFIDNVFRFAQAGMELSTLTRCIAFGRWIPTNLGIGDGSVS
jgi:F0F1-type ATP synthase beta subunit